jgi:V8-like Glu-specific endopeptidase
MKFSAAVSFVIIATAVFSLVSAETNEGTAFDSRRTEQQPEYVVTDVPAFMHSDVYMPANYRIVGGDTVQDVDTYPWFVQGRGCSGTLIAEDMVRTAAHCLGVPFEESVLLNSLTAYDDILSSAADFPVGAIEVQLQYWIYCMTPT